MFFEVSSSLSRNAQYSEAYHIIVEPKICLLNFINSAFGIRVTSTASVYCLSDQTNRTFSLSFVILLKDFITTTPSPELRLPKNAKNQMTNGTMNATVLIACFDVCFLKVAKRL